MQSYKANPGQLALRKVLADADKTRVLCYSGARAGKTFEFIRSLVLRAMMAPGSRHAVIRKHLTHVKKFIWLDTLPTVMELCFPGAAGNYEVNKTDLYYRFGNGSELWIGGLDDKDRADKILGGEYNTVFFNEVSEISWHSVSTALTRLARKSEKYITDPATNEGRSAGMLVNKAYFDTNPPAKSHWSYKLFFEHIDPESRLKMDNPDLFAAIHLRPEDNRENLSEDFLDHLKSLTGAKRKRFYEGIFQEDIHGALWTDGLINNNRREAPALSRIVVAIDPAMTSNADSDETGIIVAGKDEAGDFYVLDDVSGFYSPNGWVEKALMAHKGWEGDRIIGEANNGGDLIETVLRNKDPNAPYTKVWASRGKMVRAEPVAALYEQGRVHHTRQFTDLEYEMTTFTGKPGEVSPNRLDALVWAISSLMEESKVSDPATLRGIFF